ncbi:hypothetical protein [Streptacidiphilus neutrinimicus]|uniref:hypothetical protein n=1 Tax=Streptacidiphilus neutrinimicus TaxID=105420 RepID=UPI0005A70432|nr:hypothetical protein [Streptacidiphilus neutrinimicus]
MGLDDGPRAARQLPPNVLKLLALHRKPVRRWTQADRATAYDLVRQWTGEDHEAFVSFVEAHL